MIPDPDAPVFVVEPFTWSRGDVVEAIRDWGRLAPVERDHRAGQAALAGLRNEGREPDPVAVRRATEQVRRERGLLTRDETEGWLAAQQLELGDLVAFGERHAARQAVSLDRLVELQHALEARGASRDAARGRHAGDDDVDDLWTTLVCGGSYHEVARQLSERAAACAAWRTMVGAPTGAGRPTAAEVQRDAAAFEQAVITDDALQHALDRHQLEWISLESERLTFGEVDAAREARLCLLEGETVRTLAGYAVRAESGSYLVGDIDMERQAMYAGALAGEVLGPFADDRGFVVWSVTGRGEPTLDDPETRRRAEMEVTRQAREREVSSRVRWRAVA